MTNTFPSRAKLQKSFDGIYHGPDKLQLELDLIKKSSELNIPLETYRQLYKLRGEEEIDPYPKSQDLWNTPSLWGKWVWDLPLKKKAILAKKVVFLLVESSAILTIMSAVVRYIWEIPKRQEQTHYQAWEMINSARGERGNGGRFEALQSLNKDKVQLGGVDVSNANLIRIKLREAKLYGANFSSADLYQADLQETDLQKAKLKFTHLDRANLQKTDLRQADLYYANFYAANLSRADLGEAKLQVANFYKADFSNANFSGAEFGCDNNGYNCTNLKNTNITLEQIKEAKNWSTACYDPNISQQLGLPLKEDQYCSYNDSALWR